MASERQISANRRNAELGTGPRTAEGKAIAARNATTHGLTSREVVLPDEDPSHYEEFAESIRAELKPTGAMQEALVDRIVALAWRWPRLGRVEGELFSCRPKPLFSELWGSSSEEPGSQEQQPTKEQPRKSSRNFREDRTTFETLSRYETALDRSMYRALHELARMKAEQAGKDVPPPAVVDVNVCRG